VDVSCGGGDEEVYLDGKPGGKGTDDDGGVPLFGSRVVVGGY